MGAGIFRSLGGGKSFHAFRCIQSFGSCLDEMSQNLNHLNLCLGIRPQSDVMHRRHLPYTSHKWRIMSFIELRGIVPNILIIWLMRKEKPVIVFCISISHWLMKRDSKCPFYFNALICFWTVPHKMVVAFRWQETTIVPLHCNASICALWRHLKPWDVFVYVIPWTMDNSAQRLPTKLRARAPGVLFGPPPPPDTDLLQKVRQPNSFCAKIHEG